MTREDAIEVASLAAWQEDADFYIGQISGSWEIAHEEDMSRRTLLVNQVRVTSEGEQCD